MKNRSVFDIYEIFGDGPQSLLSIQIVIMFEVGNYEFAKCAIDRRTETESRVIRFPDRAPAAVRPINGNHVVDVTHRRQIENQRRAAHNAQGRRGEYGA